MEKDSLEQSALGSMKKDQGPAFEVNPSQVESVLMSDEARVTMASGEPNQNI